MRLITISVLVALASVPIYLMAADKKHEERVFLNCQDATEYMVATMSGPMVEAGGADPLVNACFIGYTTATDGTEENSATNLKLLDDAVKDAKGNSAASWSAKSLKEAYQVGYALGGKHG